MAKSQKPKPMKMTKTGVSKIIKPGHLFKSKKSIERQGSKSPNKVALIVKSNLEIKQNIESLDTTNFKDGVRVLFEIFAKPAESQKKRQLLDDSENPIFLQIIGIKIPKCREHTLRIDIPHSYYPKDLEICFISADLPNTNLRDYDKNTEHYENILKEQGVSNIKKIMPFHELRNEYQEFEMKRKLSSAYNVFLADSKIHGKVVHFLGNSFNKAHKQPRLVSFDKPNVKSQIERILSQTDFKVHSKGNSTGIQVGRVGMKKEQVLENVYAVAAKLPSIYPGGSANIRSITIKTTKSMAVPLYLTLKMKSDVEIPKLRAPRPKKSVSYTGELSTHLNSLVTVLPSGHVKTKQIKNSAKKTISINIDESDKISSRNEDDPNDSIDSENEDVNIDNREAAYLMELDKIKEPKATVQEDEKEIESSEDNEEVPTPKVNKIVKSAKKARRSNSNNSMIIDIKTPQKSTTPFKGTPNTAKDGMKIMSAAKSGRKQNATPNFVKGTPKTPKDKRKSTSFINTGSQKKKRLTKSPFYKGKTPE